MQQLNHLESKFVDLPVASVYIRTVKERSGEIVDMMKRRLIDIFMYNKIHLKKLVRKISGKATQYEQF